MSTNVTVAKTYRGQCHGFFLSLSSASFSIVLFFRPLGWGRETELGGEMCGWDCGGVVGGRSILGTGRGS